MTESSKFEELNSEEMLSANGGFAITITAALIALGGACFVAGFSAGVSVGLNKKNSGHY